MNALSWSKSRLLLLKFCSVALVATVFYIFLKPQQNVLHNLYISNQWEAISDHEIETIDLGNEGKKYKDKKNYNLELEVFVIPILRGDVWVLIKSYLGFSLTSQDLTVVKDKKIGSYGLFTKNNSTYLSTCIHPQGKAAFNSKEFTKLVNYNLRDRIIPWVLGLSDLRDWRCFWVNMSVDLEDINEQEATKILQERLAHIISQSKF